MKLAALDCGAPLLLLQLCLGAKAGCRGAEPCTRSRARAARRSTAVGLHGRCRVRRTTRRRARRHWQRVRSACCRGWAAEGAPSAPVAAAAVPRRCCVRECVDKWLRQAHREYDDGLASPRRGTATTTATPPPGAPGGGMESGGVLGHPRGSLRGANRARVRDPMLFAPALFKAQHGLWWPGPPTHSALYNVSSDVY